MGPRNPQNREVSGGRTGTTQAHHGPAAQQAEGWTLYKHGSQFTNKDTERLGVCQKSHSMPVELEA